MDKYGIDQVWNLSGGTEGRGLEQQLAAARRHPGRIVVFTLLDWRKALDGPGYGARMAADLPRAKALGARGVKIPKGLGLGYQDSRAASSPSTIPSSTRSSRPPASSACRSRSTSAIRRRSCEPATPDNERWDELQVHPAWSFYGGGFADVGGALRPVRAPRRAPPQDHLHPRPLRQRPRGPGARRRACSTSTPTSTSTRRRASPRSAATTADEDARVFFAPRRIASSSAPTSASAPAEDDSMLGSTGATPPTPADVERFFTSTWRYFETADRAVPAPDAHPGPLDDRRHRSPPFGARANLPNQRAPTLAAGGFRQPVTCHL